MPRTKQTAKKSTGGTAHHATKSATTGAWVVQDSPDSCQRDLQPVTTLPLQNTNGPIVSNTFCTIIPLKEQVSIILILCC